jgi:hypothetical protein
MSLDGPPTDGPAEELRPPTDERHFATALELPQFKNVRALLEGTFSTSSRYPSLAFCSLHRCGSTFAGGVLHQLANWSGMAPVDLDGYVHNLPIRTPTDRRAAMLMDQFSRGNHPLTPSAMQEQFVALIRPVGALYGPFRGSAVLNYLPAVESLRILILLRDPRDALTSSYYWTAFGQENPADPALREYIQQRRTTYDYNSVDAYVLSKSFDYLKNYRAFCAYLAANQNCVLTRYEDMVADFQGWLRIVWTILELPPKRRVLSQLAKLANLSAVVEDATAHKRQVIPGDHLRKLKPETIARLNELFHDEMEFLGYSADGRVVSPKCGAYRAPSHNLSNRIAAWLGKWRY